MPHEALPLPAEHAVPPVSQPICGLLLEAEPLLSRRERTLGRGKVWSQPHPVTCNYARGGLAARLVLLEASLWGERCLADVDGAHRPYAVELVQCQLDDVDVE